MQHYFTENKYKKTMYMHHLIISLFVFYINIFLYVSCDNITSFVDINSNWQFHNNLKISLERNIR